MPLFSRRTLIAIIAASGVAACASGHRGPPPGGGSPGGPGAEFAGGKVAPPIALLFVGFDSNSDGVVVAEEVSQALAAMFARGDANGDGWLSAFEYEAWSLASLGDSGAAPTRVGFDVDLDGSVTSREFQTRIGDEFARLDRNRDGRLERSELLMEVAARGGGGNGRGPVRVGGGPPPGGGRPPG